MQSSVRAEAEGTPRNRFEDVRSRMAKADLKKVEEQGRAAFGRVLRTAVALAGMTDKEACVELGWVTEDEPISAAQFSRWLAGTETAQLWRWYLSRRLRTALRTAEALDAGLRVRTVIEEDDRRLA